MRANAIKAVRTNWLPTLEPVFPMPIYAIGNMFAQVTWLRGVVGLLFLSQCVSQHWMGDVASMLTTLVPLASLSLSCDLQNSLIRVVAGSVVHVAHAVRFRSSTKLPTGTDYSRCIRTTLHGSSDREQLPGGECSSASRSHVSQAWKIMYADRWCTVHVLQIFSS